MCIRDRDGTPIYNTNSGYKGDENQEAEISGRDPRLYQLIDNQHKPCLLYTSTLPVVRRKAQGINSVLVSYSFSPLRYQPYKRDFRFGRAYEVVLLSLIHI